MLLVLPILVPFLTAAICLAVWRSRRMQRALGVAGTLVLMGAGIALLWDVRANGIRVVQAAGWPAPFGITLVADLFSAIMVAVASVMGAAVMVYSTATVDARRESFGYYPLYHVLLMGVCGAFLTGDIFNLYVWFEVMLISSFALLALGGEKSQIEGSIKYVTLNLVASALLLSGIGLLYGLTGTLNMADLAVKLGNLPANGLPTALAIVFMVAFGMKAAVFPLFFWLPASYHTCPVAVSAIFAGLLTKVGVYVLIRVFTLLFVHDVAYTHGLLLAVAALTMVTGVFGAMAQNEFRRVLSFHIISQIGYMILGLALYTPLALAGSIFYIVHHIIVKTNLFLVSGVARRLGGSFELKKLGGLYAGHPALAVAFLIPALSLAGLPPLSGFFAKLALVRAGLDAGAYWVVAVALAVSLLTLLSMTKIWNEAFWKAAPEGVPAGPRRAGAALMAPVALLASITVMIGFGAGPLFEISRAAAGQLLDRAGYIAAVLEVRR